MQFDLCAVFVALQGNQVAVKLLDFQALSSAAHEEMRREALAMCELRHPSIAHIYGAHAAWALGMQGGALSALLCKLLAHGS